MAIADDVLHIPIDPQTKAEADAVLTELTAKMLRQSARGEDLHEAKDAHDLFRQLDICQSIP